MEICTSPYPLRKSGASHDIAANRNKERKDIQKHLLATKRVAAIMN